jgi:hypothetical protein
MRFLNVGTLNPNATMKQQIDVGFFSNPQGDWGLAYMQAHPRRQCELVCDFHSKALLPTGRYAYTVQVTNLGPSPTNFDIDLDVF